MRWQDKLTTKEMKHLRETTIGRPTLAAFKRNREGQLAMIEMAGIEPCWDCLFIAKKLGLE